MKIPKDKLPLRLGTKMIYGQYGIMCKHPNPTAIQTGKFAGQIAYKDLSKYVVDAANNFPEALDIIERLANTNHDVGDISEIIIECKRFMKDFN